MNLTTPYEDVVVYKIPGKCFTMKDEYDTSDFNLS